MKSASTMYSQIERIPVTLTRRKSSLCHEQYLCGQAWFFGVLILEIGWFISELKLLRQRHTDSALSRPSVSRMQLPAVFIVIQLKRKQRAEVSLHKLFFCSRQMTLHTRIIIIIILKLTNMNPPQCSVT